MVTRVSPDMKDFSIVIEKMTSANSKCARGSNPDSTPTEETVVIKLAGAFLEAAKSKGLQVWYSNLASSNDQGVNPPDNQMFQKKDSLTVSEDGTVSLTVAPEELYTLTTLAVGGKGTAKSPEATPFPLPYTQSFDDEQVSAPPRIWYDQMGAWEIQKTPYGDDKLHGKVMRQVVPVWPACWGYSCTGPTTYFGPSEFKGDLTVSMDVRLEDDAVFTIDLLNEQNKNMQYKRLDLDSKGNYALGNSKGNAAFGINKWHTVTLRMAGGWQSATLDGNLLANVTISALGSETCDMSAFPVDLSGKQAMGLSAGPTSAATEEQCMQACCDAGDSCEIYQFSEHPSRNPKCWIGKSSSFGDDPSHNYKSRSRVAPHIPGWHIKVQQSRYVFASIDNFKITQNKDDANVLVV